MINLEYKNLWFPAGSRKKNPAANAIVCTVLYQLNRNPISTIFLKVVAII